MNFGYHYTSLENYKHIQIDGLVPYKIDKPDLRPFFPDGIIGVWIWTEDLCAESQVGSVLWQLMTKNSTMIVKLRVKYEYSQCLGNQAYVEIDHDGRLGCWKYHQQETAVILTEVIDPKNVSLVKAFDLVSLIG